MSGKQGCQGYKREGIALDAAVQSLGGHLLWLDALHRREQGQIIMDVFTRGWVIQ